MTRAERESWEEENCEGEVGRGGREQDVKLKDHLNSSPLPLHLPPLFLNFKVILPLASPSVPFLLISSHFQPGSLLSSLNYKI